MNWKHLVVVKHSNQHEAGENDNAVKDMLSLLWFIALLFSGLSLTNLSGFAERINRMVTAFLDVADQLEVLSLIVEPVLENKDENVSADTIWSWEI